MALDPSMSVLVVDDHDTAIRIVRTLLRQLGCDNVDDAGNAAEALTKMRAKRYGLVISGWDTKPATGCDLLREVRSDPGLNQTPFILTGESRSEYVVAAKRAGVNSYIVKPFNAQTLKAKIKAALATKTTPLPERQQVPERQQAVAASQSPQSCEAGAPAAPSAPAADRMKFDGIFTSSLE
jgi:two-component system chemotaxis response regulator CheY